MFLTVLISQDRSTAPTEGSTDSREQRISRYYPFTAAPTKALWRHDEFLRSLRSMFSKFIWAHKKARTKLSTFRLPNNKGVIGFPDQVCYYEAAHLVRVIDWCTAYSIKPWVILEQDCTTLLLRGISWGTAEISADLRLHPLIVSPTVTQNIFWIGDIPLIPSTLSLILGEVDFPPRQLKSQRIEPINFHPQIPFFEYGVTCKFKSLFY